MESYTLAGNTRIKSAYKLTNEIGYSEYLYPISRYPIIKIEEE